MSSMSIMGSMSSMSEMYDEKCTKLSVSYVLNLASVLFRIYHTTFDKVTLSAVAST